MVTQPFHPRLEANSCVLLRVRFPGAVNSKFTTEMAFINPQDGAGIPTYRVMDSDGVLVDAGRKKLDVSNEEILTWYKNMLTGGLRLLLQLVVHQANQVCP